MNCEKGIALISIKTKELIQYIENVKDVKMKKIIKSFDNKIYIMSQNRNIFIYNFFDYNLILTEKIKIKN